MGTTALCFVLMQLDRWQSSQLRSSGHIFAANGRMQGAQDARSPLESSDRMN